MRAEVTVLQPAFSIQAKKSLNLLDYTLFFCIFAQNKINAYPREGTIRLFF